MNSVVVEEPVVDENEEFNQIEDEAPDIEQEEPGEPEFELPDKFKGKEVKDIVSSYENLEKELGRKGQELGELRKLTDEILKQQLTTTQKETEEYVEEDIDFFDDPDKAVSKAIEKHPKFREFEEYQKVVKAQTTQQQLQQEHPDYLEVVQDPKFQEWVQQSPIRTQLYVSAHNYDINSARELLGTWKERSLINKTQEVEAEKSAKREAALKNGKGVSRSSAESTAGKKIYRRADLIRLKTNDPSRYEALQDEILRAYAEGRVK